MLVLEGWVSRTSGRYHVAQAADFAPKAASELRPPTLMGEGSASYDPWAYSGRLSQGTAQTHRGPRASAHPGG